MIKLTRIVMGGEVIPKYEKDIYINQHAIVSIEERCGMARVMFIGQSVDDSPMFDFKESASEILQLIRGES